MSNARFSIMQAVAVSDRRISDAQFRTLAALGMYADKNGWCFPSLKTLAADLKKSPQAVGRDTIALRKLGYLEVKNRYDTKTKSRHSNLYRLKYDLPDFNVGDTPLSTSGVDSLSTSDVEVNAPINAPKEPFFLSEKELRQVNAKVDAIIANHNPDNWKGRDQFLPEQIPLVDWYNKVTGQECTKKVQKSWWMAANDWVANNLTVRDLQAAYDNDIAWKNFIKSPVELTQTAIALKVKPKVNTEPLNLVY